MAEESLVEKMLYRLIKKHIAGTTMSSALAKAEELNSRKIPASITFLSGPVDSKSKARYITITYMELIRRISRLGLKASIHVAEEQLGAQLDPLNALKNANEIVATGNRCGVFVWVEVQNPDSAMLKLNGAKGYGLAFSGNDARRFLLGHAKPRAAKLMFDEKGSSTKAEIKDLKELLKGMNNVVLASPPEALLKKSAGTLLKNSPIVLEFKLGYSASKLTKSAKKGAMVSVSVPFGKDWTDFAMNRVPESHMRFLANNLLNEKPGVKGS